MTVGRNGNDTVWNIQILRFVASAMVLFGHIVTELMQRGMAPSGLGFIWWPGGVDIFFVISGFIMYYIAGSQFGVPGAPAKFLKRRLIRLAPPYWAFTALMLFAVAVVPSQLAASKTTFWHTFASFLFIPALNPQGHALPLLVLGWTLNFEMLFYALFAVALIFSKRIGLPVLVFGLLAVSAAFAIKGMQVPFSFWANSIALEFLFGISIAMMRRRGVRISSAVSAIMIIVAVVALVWLKALDIPGVDYRTRFLWAGVPAWLICAACALVSEGSQPGPAKRMFVFGGDMSFALYLSHPFTLTVLAALSERVGMRQPVVFLMVSFAACIVAAALIFVSFERPLYQRLTKISDRRPAEQRAERV